MLKNFLRLSFLGFVVVAGLSLSACNTAEGFGRDMEKAGQSIQKSV